MHDVFYNFLQPSIKGLKDLQLPYMDTDIFVLSSLNVMSLTNT